ncbi:hypothetical protein [Bacillus sp. UMB0893]|uniref:hypothetical protein n=1 Tax=Bacillus sp. UMB0893 TaxID=2066053 RepID=UPI000C7910C2|nr:hypothetical protein [Bacillus sp. UMB0893]PLR67925.1 hypothetical protein CYJ36_11440 [Bacillus sp. UMB0893]
MTLYHLIFLITVFFPYLQFFGVGTNTDVQLYALLVSFIIFIIMWLRGFNIKLIHYVVYLILCIITIIICYLFGTNKDIVGLFRGLFGYISLFIIPLATNYLMKYINQKKLEIILKIFYFIWAIIGLIQLFNKELLTGWRVRGVFNDGRGVISLANEPAYFSIALILISLILYIQNENKKYLFFTLLISILLAQSAVGLFYSLGILFILVYSKTNINQNIRNIGYLCILLLLFLISYKMIENSRMIMLVKFISENPLSIFITDPSLNIRFAHIFLSFKGFANNFFLPHGVMDWSEYYKMEVLKNPNLFIEPIYRLENSNGRIVSLHGRLFYELGIIALPLYLFLYNVIKKIKNGKRIFIIFILMGLNGLSLSDPMFNFVLGFILFKGEIVKNEEKTNFSM